MRIPTVKIRRNRDGKILTINRSDLKYYVGLPGFTCDLDGEKKRKTAAEQPVEEHPQKEQPVEPVQEKPQLRKEPEQQADSDLLVD